MANTRELRPGASTRVAAAEEAGAPGPGKRTLTEALPVVQQQAAPDGGAGRPAADAGVMAWGPTDDGPKDAGPKDGDGKDAGTSHAPSPDAGTPPTPPVPPPAAQGMRSFIVESRGQLIQVYVSPGVITATPDVFMFFHGFYANYGIDANITPEDDDNASGVDSGAAAMAQAKAPNTIAMFPQGIRGKRKNDGGRMGGLQPKNDQERKDKNAFPLFIDEALGKVAALLKMPGLAPRHIALAGHSAGGYKGVQDALTQAGNYDDKITDITLMDSSYSTSHFESTATWMFKGSAGKTVRIVQSQDQLDQGWESDKDDPDKKVAVKAYWKYWFTEGELRGQAAKHKMKFNQVMKFDEDSTADDRGNSTFVIQHSQILRGDGTVQCDILIMRSNLGHHEIRDNVMDDAIDSIGKGDKGSADFGKNHVADYGRDPARPHDGNLEPKPPPKQKGKGKAKPKP